MGMRRVCAGRRRVMHQRAHRRIRAVRRTRVEQPWLPRDEREPERQDSGERAEPQRPTHR